MLYQVNVVVRGRERWFVVRYKEEETARRAYEEAREKLEFRAIEGYDLIPQNKLFITLKDERYGREFTVRCEDVQAIEFGVDPDIR